MAEPQPLYEDEKGVVNGIYVDPVDLLAKHMSRWLERKDLEGKPLPAGSYNIRLKVGVKIRSEGKLTRT